MWTPNQLNFGKIRLSIKSVVHAVEGKDGATTQEVNWADEAIDAGILSCLSFFSTLGATYAVAGASIGTAVIAAAIAAGAMFFSILAGKRGLKVQGAA